jgi:hypothetical protein
LLAAVAFPLAAAAALVVTTPSSNELPRTVDLTDLVATAAPAAPAPVIEGPDSVEVTVQRNDTLDRIFRTTGIDLATLAELRMLPEVRKAWNSCIPATRSRSRERACSPQPPDQRNVRVVSRAGRLRVNIESPRGRVIAAALIDHRFPRPVSAAWPGPS